MNVLSIQSHVAYGHVGNAAAVLALQRLGHEVWPVHTVLFSNHPGHGTHRGRIVPPAEIADTIDGLAALGVLAQCDAVLSGYLGDAGTADAVLDAVARVKAANAKAVYLCDPVMGDREAGLYVGEAIVAAFRDRLVPAAGIAMPNLFELEVLSGRPVTDTASLLEAVATLRAKGPATVVVTGYADGAGTIRSFVADGSGTSTVATPRIATLLRPDGAGDLMCALFLGRLLGGCGANDALALAAASTYGVLGASVRARSPELLLVAAQEEIVRPSLQVVTESVEAP